MTNLYRVRSAFTGFPGGPGVATMYFLDTATAVASLKTYWEALKGLLPNTVTVTVEPFGEVINDVNGNLVDTWAASPQTATVGTVSGAAYAAPVGALTTWLTDTVVDNHVLKGRTYLVPATSGAFAPDGTLTATAQTTMLNAAAALVIAQSTSMVVWHRPRAAKAADGSRPAVTARDGSHGLVTFHAVPDKAVVLRSRRD